MPDRVIASKENPSIMRAAALLQRKNRKETGRFLIEGVRACGEALRANYPLERVFLETGRGLEEQALLYTRAGVPVCWAKAQAMEKLSDTKTPPGIVAVAQIRRHNLFEVPILPTSGFVVVDALQDPGNVGTVIRCAHAFGFSGVILSPGCADAYSPKVIRACAGSVFWIDLYPSTDLPSALRSLRERGVRIYSSALLPTAKDPRHTTFYGARALVLGSEVRGVSPEVLQLSDEILRIPMPGNAESLNAGVSAGILMWEMIRDVCDPNI
jgi:TrmH family RNA methyltransferase